MRKFATCLSTVICVAAVGCGGNKVVAQGESEADCTAEETTTEFIQAGSYNPIPEHDFSVVLEGDTVYFKELVERGCVSLVLWSRSNFDNHVLHVPGSVSYQGRDYKVVEIGDEAMGVSFYGSREMYRLWGTDDHQVERVILPPSVKRVGHAAFTARFSSGYRVELTDSIEYLGANAVNCMSIHDKDYAIILPANIRYVECLLDDEDHEIDGKYCDLTYSKLYIPEHLEYIGNMDCFSRNQPIFETVEVHPRNKHFRTINGVLYSYALDTLYWSTVNKDLYIPKRLRVDREVIEDLDDGWFTSAQLANFNTIVTEKGNPYCVAIDNVLYDKKNKCMLLVGGSETDTAHVPAWCESAASVLYTNGLRMPGTFVFPDNMPKESVDSIITSLLELPGERTLTFIHKGHKVEK